jgi:hypothetical protein
MLRLLTEFRDAITMSRRLIAAAHVKDTTGMFAWDEADRFVVVEAAFLKVFIAWETIQERSFLEFLMGVASANGSVMPCFVQPKDRAHAAKLLIGLGRFVDWSTPDPVRRLANNFLANGEPFESVLASIHSDLMDLKTIRNAAAHASTTTVQPLDALASRKLQRNISGISAAAFLLSTDPTSRSGSTIFEGYTSVLDAAAQRIIHA